MIDQPDLFSIGKVRHDHPDTARAAALAVAPRTGTQRRRVLERIAARPSTDDEIQRALNMNGNTERPRRVELVDGGWVRDSGLRRKGAIVWELARAVEAA